MVFSKLRIKFREEADGLTYDTILAVCKKKGVSIAKIEKDCGIGNGTIRGWNVSKPRVDNLKRVADYLGVPIESLLK